MKTQWTIFKLDPILPISDLAIMALVNSFWKKVAKKFSKNQKFRVQAQYKIGYSFRSLSYIQILDNSIESREIFIKLLISRLEIQSSKYHDMEVDELFLRYKIIKDKNVPITINDDPQDLFSTTRLSDKDIDLDLPNTMNLINWDKNITFIGNNAAFYIKNDLKYTFIINDDGTEVKSKITDMFNNVIVEFTDIRDTKDNVNTFNRVIKGETLSYVNGVKVGSFRNDTKFISKIDKSSDFIFNVITMDLETRTINNGLEAISNAIYDGEDYKTFFITDYKNSEEMLRDSLKYLMQDKYNNHHIYLHNFSKFDGIFLLRIIANLDAKVNVLIRDNNLLNISITFEDISILDGEDKTNKCTIHFHDSLLLLPSSLEKLAKNFGVESKGSFDFKKINQATTNDQLNLIRDKLLDYNKQDCLVLYQVMKEFAVNIFHLYSLNIINYPTISSLSFAIFRSNFMKEEIIPISNLKDYNFIKESYRGGHVDVYRPFTKKGRKVYCYDINSLYPFVMANNLFPTGIPKYFYGSRDLNDIFGFVKVNVTCPNNMFCPVLLTRINDKTIAPIGQWTGVYFTEELKYAATLGYKFEILEGVTFDKTNIFEDFIKSLYDQRLQYPKGDPRNLIAKLLMNTQYGRYGMSPYIESYSIMDKIDLNENTNYLDSLDLGNKELISIRKIKNQENNNFMMNISIGIASAVTAYSRIVINKLKLQFAENLLYSDTDSIFTDVPIPDNLINNELGGLKLEYIFEDAVFLAPKVYGGILENGKEFSKVKGFTKSVPFSDLKTLLIRDKSLLLKHDKWFRDYTAGNINIKNTTYNLIINSNKRKIIYQNNKFVNTKPIKLKNKKQNPF